MFVLFGPIISLPGIYPKEIIKDMINDIWTNIYITIDKNKTMEKHKYLKTKNVWKW